MWGSTCTTLSAAFSAAGTESLGLHNDSKPGGDTGGVEWTAENQTERRNRPWVKRLAPEVARHQPLRNRPGSEFESLPGRHAADPQARRERDRIPASQPISFQNNPLQSLSALLRITTSPCAISFRDFDFRSPPLAVSRFLHGPPRSSGPREAGPIAAWTLTSQIRPTLPVDFAFGEIERFRAFEVQPTRHRVGDRTGTYWPARTPS